jgi:hypothetical protein
MRAFREERYGDLWDQFVAERGARTRETRRRIGRRRAERFIDWCAAAREDAMMLFNRMSYGFSDERGRGRPRRLDAD